MQKSEKLELLTCFCSVHNIYKWFTVIVVIDLTNDFEINAALE